MVHYAAVLVLAVLVGSSSAFPQTRRSQPFRRQAGSDVDADAEAGLAVVADNSLGVAATEVPSDAVDADLGQGGQQGGEDNALGLPSNATSIRAKIVDSFSCEGRVYGYYADVANECQVFHVCLPVQQPGSKGKTFKWSFICPAQTIFNQEKFTCTRPEDAPPCEEAEDYFRLNANFGVVGKPEDAVDVVASSRSAVDAADAAVDVEQVTDVAVKEDAVEATTTASQDSS